MLATMVRPRRQDRTDIGLTLLDMARNGLCTQEVGSPGEALGWYGLVVSKIDPAAYVLEIDPDGTFKYTSYSDEIKAYIVWMDLQKMYQLFNDSIEGFDDE